MVGAQSSFDLWFQEFIYYAGPILQLVVWVAIIVGIIVALVLFKRLVDFQTGRGGSAKKDGDAAGAPADGPEINVDEFVE